jgi:hypothetical protein
MAITKKSVRKPSQKAKTTVRSASVSHVAAASASASQYGTKVRLGAVVLLLLSIAFLLMVLTKYT